MYTILYFLAISPNNTNYIAKKKKEPPYQCWRGTIGVGSDQPNISPDKKEPRYQCLYLVDQHRGLAG